MKYTKPSLTFADQAVQLMARGLVASSQAEVEEKLAAVSYYRLSAYWYNFRRPDGRLVPGTTLEEVWSRYTFDRQLRLLTLDVIERAEVAIRTNVVNLHTLAHGPFGYVDNKNLPGLRPDSHLKFLQGLDEQAVRSSEEFLRHYKAKYTSEQELPLWMACELMSFGNLFTLFRGLPKPMKHQVASIYGVTDTVLESWLTAINAVRNNCAHHGRLWNKVLGVKPMIPRVHKNPEWHIPVRISDDRIFGVLTVLRFLLRKIAPQSHWQERFETLLASYPNIPQAQMGIPANWKSSPLWA